MPESYSVGGVVINYNSFKQLKSCIKAIQRQEVPFSGGVIIDNDSDRDNGNLSISIPEGWKYVRLNSNVGFAEANNIAIENLKSCEWIALINPDAYLHPDWLKQMTATISLYPAYSFFASRLIMAGNDSKIDGLGDTYHMSGLVWRYQHNRCFTSIKNREVFSPCAAAALYHRDAFVEAGGFDPAFFCYVEDVDLGFRMRLLGHRCLLVADAVAYHEGSASSGGQQSDFAIYHGHRNMVWTYVKNMPGVLFWLFLPFHLALNLLSLVWFGTKGKGSVIVRAKIDAVKGLWAMWPQRKRIQSRRKLPLRKLLSIMDTRLLPKQHRREGTYQKVRIS